MERLLVIGGRGGIGQAVVKQAKVQFEVGVADQEEFDLANGAQIVNFFGRTDKWDHVVVAAGVNGETSIKGINLHRSALLMAQVNYIGPMVALQAWLRKTQKPGPRGHFV